MNYRSQLYSFATSSGDESDEEMDLMSDEDEEFEDLSDNSNESNSQNPDVWDRFPEHIHNSEYNPDDATYWGAINMPNVSPFRGRVRMGRGGRLFIDRTSSRVTTTSTTEQPIMWY